MKGLLGPADGLPPGALGRARLCWAVQSHSVPPRWQKVSVVPRNPLHPKWGIVTPPPGGKSRRGGVVK
jgi:hypothetical protein